MTSSPSGASPRARGNPRRRRSGGMADGCIPASAGESTTPARRSGRTRVHPRERGGIASRRPSDGEPQGASPRARGNRAGHVGELTRAGCIPASAGESTPGSNSRARSRVHPRERGGIALVSRRAAIIDGASPRARGNLQRRSRPLYSDGCIPASAGESTTDAWRCSPARVHPRERGGIFLRWLLAHGVEGASPRARGNLRMKAVEVRESGCIPASAGESGTSCRRPLALWVHPRERGGIAIDSAAWSAVTGASPRARGNPD